MSAHAVVRITVEIPLDDSWGDDCTVAQIRKQAQDGARTAIMQGLVLDGLVCGPGPKKIARIVGEPIVDMIVKREP